MTPWDAPVAAGALEATVTIDGSKSATARALVLAALADGPSVLSGVLQARDSRLMREALAVLGVRFSDRPDGSLLVEPPARFTGGGTIECGLSGTVMRFVPPLAALATAPIRFVGDPEASARPVAPLLRALADLGTGVTGDTLPFTITPTAAPGNAVTLDASGSSQFVSGLLLAGCRFPDGLTVRHVGPILPSRPHVDMTVTMLRRRGVVVDTPEANTWVVQPGRIAAVGETVEPDLTNAATVLAAALVTRGRLRTSWPEQSLQAADALLAVLAALGARITREGDLVVVDGRDGVRGATLDLREVSEFTCAAAALAALADGPTTISGVAHVRGHETDRLAALERELTALGGHVSQTQDGLRIRPAPLHGGLFRTYADHRMAHAGALIGLAVPGIRLDDVGCTTKTLPDFPGLWTAMLAGSR